MNTKSSDIHQLRKFLLTLIVGTFLFGCTASVPQQSTNPATQVQESPASTAPRCQMTTIQEPYEDRSCNDAPYQEQECTTVPYTDRVCETKKLLFNYADEYGFTPTTCYWPDIFGGCSNIKVNCSFIINNLDDEPGNWMIEAKLFDKMNQQVPFRLIGEEFETDSLRYTVSVQPKASKEARSGFIPVTNPTLIARLHNGGYCKVTVLQEPTKQVCRDVIKNRQVCNPVTRYRQECNMITKYREVQREICNGGGRKEIDESCVSDDECQSGVCDIISSKCRS